jgi:hypothetical protein
MVLDLGFVFVGFFATLKLDALLVMIACDGDIGAVNHIPGRGGSCVLVYLSAWSYDFVYLIAIDLTSMQAGSAGDA